MGGFVNFNLTQSSAKRFLMPDTIYEFLITAELPPVTEVCLGCICQAISGCKQGLQCEGETCGLFRITWGYWADAGKPTINGLSPDAPDGKFLLRHRHLIIIALNLAVTRLLGPHCLVFLPPWGRSLNWIAWGLWQSKNWNALLLSGINM